MDCAAMEEEEDEEFGILRPTLIKQLRSILDQYPDDGQILKELIQNAEDAKASRICFLYDETQHGQDPDKLAHPDLDEHQGPALYAFNDAIFSESDWKGIRMLQDSVKTKDPMKVGRFGLGFKSVFHLTDLPSVMSGRSLAFIDPHEKYFNFQENRTTGKRFNLNKDNSTFKHQFEPYLGLFGCDEETFTNKHFNGTLFRFPLRKTESSLSETCYTSKKIFDLFKSFKKDAHLMLLFLKHVESIELCVRKQGHPIESLFKVQMQENTRNQTRQIRQEFLSKISASSWPDKAEEITYPVQLEVKEHGAVENKYVYVISEYFGGGNTFSKELQSMCSDEKCRNIPLVGSAFLIGLTEPLHRKRKSGAAIRSPKKKAKLHEKDEVTLDDENDFEAEGHVFCSLPLPIEQRSSTGLPVHVNGYFSIGQDRRHLKWPSKGQDISKDGEVFWNQCLLRELIPKAYVNLIQQMVQLCLEGQMGVTPEHIVQALPDKLQVEVHERWKGVLEPFYTQLFPCKVFNTKNGWLPVCDCVLNCSRKVDPSSSAVEKVLEGIGVNVVRLPDHVMLAISNYLKEQPKTITPSLTRSLISQAMNIDNANLNLTGLSFEERKGLCEFLGQTEDQYLPPDQIKALSLLPLFETIPYGKNMETQFVAVSDVPRAAPEPLPVQKISTPLLDLRSEYHQSLSRLLKVKVLSQAEFLTDVVFLELQLSPDKEKLDMTLDFVMTNFHRLQEVKEDFVEQLQKLPFLQSQTGNYVTITKLFDPEDAFLWHFFYAEDMFPRAKFSSGQPLIFLRQVGLRKRSDIQPAHILTSVMKLQNLHDSGMVNPNTVEKSNAVVKHIHENPAKLESFHEGKQLRHWLNECTWMACLTKRPEILPEALDLYQGIHVLLKPGSLLPLEVLPTAGCVAPVCESPFASSVLQTLGVSERPSVELVLQQMKVISEAYQPREKAKFLHLVESIYAYLEKEDASEVLRVVEEIQLKDWVWNGQGFTSIDKVVTYSTHFDWKPHLFILPEEMEVFMKMFENLGVKGRYCTSTSIAVLQAIKDLHETLKQPDEIEKRDLQIAIGILNILKEDAREIDSDTRKEIVIPVNREGVLCLLPIDDCTYCDLDWLQQGSQSFLFEETEDVTFIHPSIPLDTAEALFIPTLMNRMLQSDELPMTGFGQSETLTNRIKSLLEGYTDGYAIVKELVQNADDAGATVVKFLYDERSNIGQEIFLLDEGMKECQGPAFWAYNDAMFSEKDFENITKLGGATKEKEVDKIGKFGLGFNAVYNVTDVPSFVSGRYLAIFDPQTTHLGRCIRDRSKPGMKIDLMKNKTLIRKLPHQFFPYQNIFGCHIDPDEPSEYPGTLFRLPLRTSRQASSSEISKKPYNNREMLELLSLFVKGSDSLLLFTQHVCRIELHHISADGGEPELLFSVAKDKLRTVTPIPNDPNAKFNVLSKFNNNFQSKPDLNDVMQTSMLVEMRTDFTETAVSYFGDTAKSSSKAWMLSFVFNTNLTNNRDEKGYCPYGAAAIPLKKSEEDFIPNPLNSGNNNQKGMLYCHLPLPMHTNLPVHINGAFAVQSDRRHLHMLTDDDKYSWKAEWNDSLLKQVVVPAYYLLLNDLLHMNTTTPVDYAHLWPIESNFHVQLNPLVEAFYQNDKLMALVMRHDGLRHITLSQAAVFDRSLSNSQHKNLAIEVFKQGVSELIFINLPLDILDAMILHNMCAVAPQMFDEKRFLLDIFFPHVSELENALRDTVLLWSFELEDDQHIKNTLKWTACIPASPDGNELKPPSEMVHPDARAKQLYHSSEGRFCHLKGIEKYSELLKTLGIKTDYLNWDDIIERGHAIERLLKNDSEEAVARAKLFIKYLDEKLQSQKSASARLGTNTEDEESFQQASVTLSQMKILPLCPPPHDRMFKWRNEVLEMPLVSAREAYLSSQSSLLSSCCAMVEVPKNVSQFLNLKNKAATVELVVLQLNAVVNARASSYKLHSIAGEIYDFLNQKCEQDNSGSASLKVVEGVGEKACILVNDRFVSPLDVAFDDELGAAPPLLFPVPKKLAKFNSLLKALGVRNKFETLDFIRHLKLLKDKYGEKPLDRLYLKVCVQILHGLEGSMTREKLVSGKVVKNCGIIFVPNIDGVLEPSSILHYNDYLWMKVAPSMNLTHQDITYVLAKSLGVTTHRRELLKDRMCGFRFGQTAKLTSSLRRIVESYPLNHEILKELIQNADDAGATEIHFVLDQRSHGTEKIFDDSWKPLQGPALCVYNNKPFTTQDLEGIQQLGDGSKQKDPCKTGKFGIGFSSVYHLTDAPSIMTTIDTGRVLCVFDPHCCYVPEADETAPGIQFSDLEYLKQIFPDVFSGYLEESFKTRDSTMFRLPLRTKEMAEKSKISKRAISPNLIKEMLKMLKDEAKEMLLFLSHLEVIKISVSDANGELVHMGSFHARLNDEDAVKRHKFHEECMRVGSQMKSLDISIADVKEEKVEYNLELFDETGKCERWHVNQVVGFKNPNQVSKNIRDAYEEGNLVMMPRGGVACPLSKQPEGRVYCNLPMPLDTQLPVHINGHFAMSFENRRFIWQKSGSYSDVKIEWNTLLCEDLIANAYVDMLKSVRHEFVGSSQVCQQVNDKLNRHNELTRFEHVFPKYRNDEPYEWQFLVKAVYALIHVNQTPLFPCIREYRTNNCQVDKSPAVHFHKVEWLSLSGSGKAKAFFCKRETSLDGHAQKPYWSHFRSTNSHAEDDPLKDILRRCHISLVEIGRNLIDTMSKCGFQLEFATPENVISIFKSYTTGQPLCDISKSNLPVPINETNILNLKSLIKVLEFCKCSVNSLQQFMGAPLLLTQDNKLHVFDARKRVYVTAYCRELQSSCGDQFVHERLQQRFFSNLSYDDLPLARFTASGLESLLPRALPKKYQQNEELQLELGQKVLIEEIWTFLDSQLDRSWFRKEKEDQYEERMKRNSKSIVEHVSCWCLVPVCKGDQTFLYRTGRLKEVVKRDHRSLDNALDKLEVPHLDSRNVGNAESFIQQLTAGFQEPVNILAALYKVYNTSCNNLPKLTHFQMKEVLEYFTEHSWKLQSNEAIRQLRTLPFFKTICGDFISLEGCSTYVLPEDVVTQEMDVFRNSSGEVFLEMQKKLLPLLRIIGCRELGIAELYNDFILQHFEYLSEHARMVHLMHLYEAYLEDDNSEKLSHADKSRLLSTLRDLDIIEGCDGEFHQASYFYDPDVPLYQVMIEKSKLAPEIRGFPRNKWLSFLRKIGLTSDVTPELCIQLAQQIESEAKIGPRKSAIRKSKALAKHLLCLKTENKEEILQKVHCIPFIAPYCVSLELAHIYRQYGAISDGALEKDLPFISFKGSYSSQFSDIIWTSASILPDWADPFSRPKGDELAKLLQVNDKPSLSLVVDNVKSICSACCERPDLDPVVIKRVFKELYEFSLANGFEDDQPIPALLELKDFPCVAVGAPENFAHPWKTSFEILERDEIRPYFFKVPHDYGDYRTLLTALGSSEAPTVQQYHRILDKMHIDTCDKRLSPNELILAYRALKGLFDSLERGTKIDSLVGSLSLLSGNGYFQEATTLLFNDMPWLNDRVKSCQLPFLVDLQECGLKENPEDLLTRLPSHWKPQMMSCCVSEVLTKKSKEQLVSSEICINLQRRLDEKELHFAVERLAHHQAHKSGKKLSSEVLQSALDNLSSITVYAAEELKTYLMYKGKRIKGSGMQKACSFEKAAHPSGSFLFEVYLKNDDEMGTDIFVPFTEVLNHILNDILKESAIYLLPLLAKAEVGTNICLDRLDVLPDISQVACREPTLPLPGSSVPSDLHYMLHDAEGGDFKVGSYVAFKDEDGGFKYGKILTMNDKTCHLSTGEDRVLEQAIGSLKTFCR